MVHSFTGLYKWNYEDVFLQVWPQLSFTDCHMMEDLPSIPLEYDIDHNRHKIPMNGIHSVIQRDYPFFPCTPVVFTIYILALGAREGIGGVWQREVLELIKLCFFFFLSFPVYSAPHLTRLNKARVKWVQKYRKVKYIYFDSQNTLKSNEVV